MAARAHRVPASRRGHARAVGDGVDAAERAHGMRGLPGGVPELALGARLQVRHPEDVPTLQAVTYTTVAYTMSYGVDSMPGKVCALVCICLHICLQPLLLVSLQQEHTAVRVHGQQITWGQDSPGHVIRTHVWCISQVCLASKLREAVAGGSMRRWSMRIWPSTP